MINNKTIILLERINNHLEIQNYMDIVSSDVRSLIVFYSNYIYQKQMHRQTPIHYMIALKKSLDMGTTESIENSGSVFSHDIKNVLTGGNVRERCSVFQNLFFKDREYRIIWCLLNTYNKSKTIPACIDFDTLLEYSTHIEEENKCIYKKNIKNIICDSYKYRKRKTRCVREDTTGFELHVQNTVPKLSTREKKFINSQFPLGLVLPWKTGHMSWIVNQNSNFALDARMFNKETVAGPSGHTHAMLCFMKLLVNFDLKKWVLICILWLVGSEHHSIHEVLLVAHKNHGLEYDMTDDCYEVVNCLLDDL